ncbi:Vacuolar protein sorting-associated protein vps13, related [Eimeria mitis]|uniref:Vacuolar protein sorting-associated protein vps13, related n=1 Tax=Eimeria mitis TaxID=44415 RepID=U6KDA4_9EIME|nr:Vacuolar protein sorting-associated protein vps13, related [Eimeria mitis]CDJ35909.1 Vacuolar protein sorting-associated protein vps13, related [Eimeria mitis]
MLESLLLPHLNTALSAVFEDLEPHQLYASILGGSLVLRNLKLKPDALAALSIPVDVTYGHVEKLEIKLNLLRLLTEPIVVKAEGVLVVGTTQPPSAWDAEREEFLRDQQRNLTLLTDECLTYAREESGLPSVLQRAAYAVIQRIQISVSRLEVRLEDTETASGQHFAFGLRATRLFNVRCDSNWDAEGQPSAGIPTSGNGSAGHPTASRSTSCQSWLDWIKSFGGRQGNNEAPDEKIPEAFHLKTVMEDTCAYLDPINNGHEQVSWLPYPASYRGKILEDLQKYLLVDYQSSNAKESTPWSIFRRPGDGEGQGIAGVLPLSTLSQTVNARRMRTAATSGVQASTPDQNRQREVGIVDKGAANSIFHPPAAVDKTENTGTNMSYNADQQEKRAEFLRFSDLYCPKVLWQIANRTAAHHMYILKPGEVEVRVRCVQRPTAPSPGSERAFPRPSPSASYLRSACDDASGGPVVKGESRENVAATAELEKEPLPALTVIIVSRNSLLQFTTFQVACIFRWLHYAIFLYQELVSGVYAECLELTPTEDEMANYRSAWRRHLVSYALTATNTGKALSCSTKAGQCKPALASASSVETRDWETQGATDEKVIQEFEAKYWPTVILPLRQLALQDLKQKACRGQSQRVASYSAQQYTGGGGITISRRTSDDGQAVSRIYCRDADGPECVVASSGNGAQTGSVQGLVDEIAEELSEASEAELQMIKCIQQMQPCRFSKSVQFAVELYDLEVTLAAAYEAPACIRVNFDELYAHNAMFYDLRMQLVAAFEGVQITDNLMPNLNHRRVVASRSRTRSCTEGHKFADPSKGLRKDSSAEPSISSSGCASCGSNHIHGTPPLSPLQPINTACILDWSTNCVRQGCPLQISKKEYDGGMQTNQEARAGGWMRFDKSFVPLEGIPDMRLYLQTRGSLLCTVSPAAVAYLVEALQEPVHLVQGSSILEAASREVQDALHRNELFLAQLLVGEVDHPRIDMCVDVPASHKLLLPFSHDISQCRGVLFHSGVISVDSRLKESQQQPYPSGQTNTGEAYDRYSIIITGACLQRVINCQQVECSLSACQKDSCALLNSKADAPKRCSVALTEIATNEIRPHNTSSSVGSKCSRWEELRTNSAARRHREWMRDSTDNRLEMSGQASVNEAGEASGRFGSSESMDDGPRKYILWPVGFIANIDVCNNLHRPTDLPAFAIIFQDQDFSRMQRAGTSLRDKEPSAFDESNSANLQPVAPLRKQLTPGSSTFEEVENKSDDYPEFDSKSSETALDMDESSESSQATEHESSQRVSNGLIGFDVRLGLSILEFRLYKEKSTVALRTTTASAAENAASLTGRRIWSLGNNLLLRCSVGNSRMRLSCLAQSTYTACMATVDEVCVSLGRPVVADTPEPVLPEARGGGHDQLSGMSDASIGSKHFQRTGFASSSSSSEGCTIGGAANMGHVPMDSDPCGASPAKFPVEQYSSTPFVQFMPPQCTNYIDIEQVAADVAAALSEAANFQGQSSSSVALPSATVTALRRALASKRLRLTTRWMFPPPYPGMKASGEYKTEKVGESSEMEEQDSRCNPVTSGSACGGSSNPYDTISGGTAESAAKKADLSAFSSSLDPLRKDAAEEEVLVEDLVGDRCFFIPACMHAAIATRKTWQALATKVPAVSVEASLCLKALIHSMDVRCTPLRITLDWGIVSEHIGIAGEVACDASNAYAAAAPKSAAPAEAATSATGPESQDPSIGQTVLESDKPTAGSRDKSGAQNWNSESVDVVLAMQNGDELPWRVRISILVTHCDVVVPTSTPSPYPNLPLAPVFCSDDQLFWLQQIPSCSTRHPPRRKTLLEAPAVSRKVQPRSSVSSQYMQSSSKAISGLESAAGSPVALRHSGRNRESEADRMPREGTQNLLEAILATAPPVCVFSFSATTSFYSECHSFVNANDADSRTGEPGNYQDGVKSTPKLHKTMRLLGHVNQVRSELLQGPGGSEKALANFVEILRKVLGLPGRDAPGRPALGGCLRPTGFGAPDLPPLTLLDGHRIARSLSCNARRERSASATVSQPTADPVLDVPLTSSASQTRGFRASVDSNRKGRTGYQTVLTVERHAIIDGCRCRMRASYRTAAGPGWETSASLTRAEEPPPDSMPNEKGAKRGIGAETAGRRCSQAANVCQRGEKYSENEGEAVIELEPLLVHLEPSVVVAGMSLLQLLQKLFLTSPTAASALPAETAEMHSGKKEADGSVKVSEINDTSTTTDLKRPRTCFANAEPSADVGVLDNSRQRTLLAAPCLSSQKHDAVLANASFLAMTSPDGIGRVQSSFESPESSFSSAVAEGFVPFAGTPRGLAVDEGLYQCTIGSSAASRSKESGVECHSESTRNRTTAALEDTAKTNEDAENALSWFWRILNSLDAVLILRIRMECIQFESPSLHFTVEDLEVLGGRQQLRQIVPPEPKELPRTQRGTAKKDDKEQKEFLFGIKMMLSAEALHKERIALESILEPWYCSVDLRYTPGDLLLKTLLPRSPLEKTARQLTERPTVMKRAKSVWASGAHVKDLKQRDGRQRSILFNTKSERKSKYFPNNWSYRGSEGDFAAAEARRGIDTHGNCYPWTKDSRNRSRKLQQLARIWGKYGTELCAEVYCSWINLTAAPFLMDAVLDTANLIEAAQRALQEQLNKQQHLRVALRSGSPPSFFQQSKSTMKSIDFSRKNIRTADPQGSSDTHALPEGNSRIESAAPDVSPERRKEGLDPSKTLGGAESASASAAEGQSYLEHSGLATGPLHSVHPPSVSRVHGSLGSPAKGLQGPSQNNVAVEEQPLPLLVNMTGLLLLVHVPNPERRASDAQGEESNSLILDHHLVTDDFGITRRKAFATIAFAASNPSSTTSEEAEDDEHDGSNSLDGSAYNAATNANPLTPLPETQADTDNATGGWRHLCHGESFHVPLDDHGQTRKVVVRLQIAGSEFEIDDLCLDGSQVSVRELPIKLPAHLNNPPMRDARKRQRHELLHASARILVFPHPAVAVLDTPVEDSSTASSSSSVDDRQSVEAPKGPSPSSRKSLSPNRNTDTINVPSAPVSVESLAPEPLVQKEVLDTASHEHSDANSEHSARRAPSSDGRSATETTNVSPCCPLNIQERGGVVHVPLSWILPRAVVAHTLGYLGLDRTREGSFVEPRDSPAKPDPLSATPRPEGTPAVHPADAKPQTSNSLFFWRHKNLTDQTNRGAAVMTVPLTSIKIHGKATATRGPRVASSEEVEAFPNFYNSIMEKWKDDMAVEPLYIIPSSCVTAMLGTEENTPDNKGSNGRDGNTETPAQRLMPPQKSNYRRLTTDNRRRLIALLSNRQSTPAYFEAQGMEAKGYYDLYSLVRSIGAKPLLEHSTLQQIALETSHSIISFDCRPQVLEFFYRQSPSNKVNTDAAGDPISSTLDQSTHINIDNNEGSRVVSNAIAVTVYGQSRDLVSESDPLFFEVGLNAPISLGNRLFEPLRVSVIPSSSATAQRHPAAPTAPDNQERLLPYGRIAAGGDIDVQRAANGFVFELETTACGSEYRHIYESKPLLIDCHAPAPASALDLTVCFVRSRILDSSGNRIQQRSALYRHLSRHQPSEFSVQAEVLGWVQQSAGSSNVGGSDNSSSSCDYAGLTNIKRHMWCTCVRMIRIFAPFWLVNRQPEALAVSYCRRPIQYMASFDWRLLGVPSQGKAYLALGIAPDDEAAHLRLQTDAIGPALAEDIKAARSRRTATAKLSPAFRIDIVGRPSTVSVRMNTSGNAESKGTTATKSRHFGVTVALAPPPFSRSRIISIHSRFILRNCLSCDIWVKETNGDAPPLRLVPGCQCAFHPQALGPRGEALICITKTDPAIIETLTKTDATATTQLSNSHGDGVVKAHSIEKVVWSSQLSVSRSASIQVRLKTPVEPLLCSAGGIDQRSGRGVLGKGGRALSWEHHNIHIAIRSLENAAFAVVFSEPLASEYLLVNNTNHIIAFAQSGIRSKHVWEILDRGSQVDYAWTDPQREKKCLRFSFWDQNQKVVKTCDIARVRLHRPLTLPNSKEKVYFVTDVRGSRRRVTITLDAPSAALKDALGARRVWKNLQHDLFKIRRKRAQHKQKREIKALTLTRPHSQIDVWRPIRAGRKLTVPTYKRQLSATPRERETGADQNALSVPLSQTTVPKDPLRQRKTLRFQKRETLSLARRLRSGTVAGSAESSSGSSVFAEDTGANEGGQAASGSGESQEMEAKDLRRHRMTTLLNRRSIINVPSSRNIRNSFKRTGKGGSYELSQRTPVSSTSSEMNQVDEPSKDASFLEMGFYGGIILQGFGISLVDPTPHELAFFCVSGIRFEVGRLHKASVHDIRFCIKSLQIDNGVQGAQHRTILRHATLEERVELHGESKLVLPGDGSMTSGASEGLLSSVAKPLTAWESLEESQGEKRSLFFRLQLGGQWRDEATLLDYVDVELAPIALHVEADTTSVLLRFLMQLVQNRTFFLMSLQERNIQLVQDAAGNKVNTSGYQQLRAFPQTTVPVAASLKPLYIHELAIRPMLIIFSTRSQRLQRGHDTSGHGNLVAIRQFEVLGDRMTDITNFPMKSRLLVQQCVFTNAEQLVTDLGSSYIQQCIWQLHKLVASIDVIGNPLRLITGVSSSLRLATAHPSDGMSTSS